MTAAVFALRERERSGRGQWIDISAQEVGASRNTAWILAAQFDGRHAARNGPYLNLGRRGEGNRTIWRLKDGYAAWQISPPQSPQTRAFAAWMDDLGFPRPEDEEAGAAGPWSGESKAAWEAAIGAFLAERTRAEIMTEGYRRGCDAAAVNTPADLVEDPQFQARGVFGPPDPSIAGSPRLPSYFIRTSCEAPAPAAAPVLEEVP
jgi:crotonobetainyl-CoA:carnitine CoA-transferase CaiB-like acyl-CoA transferase